ncbi:hypothetical protein, partial [Ileibacterium valens]|uniref:hypothetical protein n=1 Tax=Ileibacterium valens TaxID=1862668 RepID=UPI00272A10FC
YSGITGNKSPCKFQKVTLGLTANPTQVQAKLKSSTEGYLSCKHPADSNTCTHVLFESIHPV